MTKYSKLKVEGCVDFKRGCVQQKGAEYWLGCAGFTVLNKTRCGHMMCIHGVSQCQQILLTHYNKDKTEENVTCCLPVDVFKVWLLQGSGEGFLYK